MGNIDASPACQPSDTLHVWWLQDPAHPVLIGTPETLRTLRGVSLRYAPGWLSSGFALGEDLPLIDTTFLPSEKDTAAGAVDDALSEHAPFGLDRRDAEAQMRGVAQVVAGWKAHFVKAGVRDADIDGLRSQIDRPVLADQRKAWAGAA